LLNADEYSEQLGGKQRSEEAQNMYELSNVVLFLLSKAGEDVNGVTLNAKGQKRPA